MSAASSSFQGSYDVFLNFRGKDTRNSFTAHLYEAMCNNGIQTFMDASKIVKGEEISPALDTAMEKSRFCVVVLSKNYASSTWCLDELVQILKCKNAKKQTVLPIFYDVDPSDVREQTGSFAESFAKHEEKFKGQKERVQIWKQALREVARIAGWDVRDRHEPTIIKEIIQHVSNRSSKDAKAIVGIDSDLQVKERSLMSNTHTLSSSRERSEFPLTRKRKINEIKEAEIRQSRDAEAIEVHSDLEIMEPYIPSLLSVGDRSEIRLTSKRKIEEEKETTLLLPDLPSPRLFTTTPARPPPFHSSFFDLLESPRFSPLFISPPTSPPTSPVTLPPLTPSFFLYNN